MTLNRYDEIQNLIDLYEKDEITFEDLKSFVSDDEYREFSIISIKQMRNEVKEFFNKNN